MDRDAGRDFREPEPHPMMSDETERAAGRGCIEREPQSAPEKREFVDLLPEDVFTLLSWKVEKRKKKSSF